MTFTAWVETVFNRVMNLKPMRAFTWYIDRRGPLLSAGLSYRALFAVFAAIWLGFAIAGTFIYSNPAVQEALFDLLARSVPGLIDDGSGNGAINPQDLVNAGFFGLTGLIAAGVLLFTAFGWLGAGRDAVRTMFRLPGLEGNFLLIWLKDLGLAVAFGAAVIVSAIISVLSTFALSYFYDWIGLSERSDAAYWIGRTVGVLLVFVVDVVILAFFYRTVSGIRIPMRLLVQGSILAAIALGVLKILGQLLLAGATSNPLLASFAVIIGLLIWFNLVCQVILMGSAWIAIGAADHKVSFAGQRAASDPAVNVGAAG